MSTMEQNAPDLAALAGLEEQLAAQLTRTSDDVEHMECLDQEQRAEVYTILRALRSDTELNRAAVDLLARRIAERREAGHA